MGSLELLYDESKGDPGEMESYCLHPSCSPSPASVGLRRQEMEAQGKVGTLSLSSSASPLSPMPSSPPRSQLAGGGQFPAWVPRILAFRTHVCRVMHSWPQVRQAIQHFTSWTEVAAAAIGRFGSSRGSWRPWEPWDESGSRRKIRPEHAQILATKATAGSGGWMGKGQRLTIGTGAHLQIGAEAPFWEWTDPHTHLAARWHFPTGLLSLRMGGNPLDSLFKDKEPFFHFVLAKQTKGMLPNLVCQDRISAQRPGGQSLRPLGTARLPIPDST